MPGRRGPGRSKHLASDHGADKWVYEEEEGEGLGGRAGKTAKEKETNMELTIRSFFLTSLYILFYVCKCKCCHTGRDTIPTAPTLLMGHRTTTQYVLID